MPKYYWIIEKDHIENGHSNGVDGPGGCDTTLRTNPAKFEMFDDDGTLYYSGTIYGVYDGCEPLDDYGMPGAGCTRIDVAGKTLRFNVM